MPRLKETEKVQEQRAKHCLFEGLASRITQVQENDEDVSVRRNDIFACKRSLIFVPASQATHVNRRLVMVLGAPFQAP